MTSRKIIFAGVARDVAPYLSGVTANIEAFAKSCGAFAVLVAENDSRDATRTDLRAWMERLKQLGAARASLMEMESLDAAHPQRADRIAQARNRILREIERDKVLSSFDYLAVLDLDDPNAYPQPPEQFVRALDFLEAHEDVAGVFANQVPLYYDIWALREKNWCPDDCWQEVARESDEAAATAKYIHGRQRIVDPASPPMEVDSAFGGLGLYRLSRVLGHNYEGQTPDGAPVCEHVGFHAGIRRSGGRFFILPGFLNVTSFDHTALAASHAVTKMGAHQGHFLVPRAVAGRRALFSHGGEAFARLAGHGREGGVILDLGPQGGTNLIDARLMGCASRYICVEETELEYAVLCGNARTQSELFGDHALIHADPASGLARFGNEAGLIRMGTGQDASALLTGVEFLGHRPLIWARIETAEEAPAWEKTLDALPYEFVMAFNALGAKIADGPLAEQKKRLSGIFHRLPKSGGGLDLVFSRSKGGA